MGGSGTRLTRRTLLGGAVALPAVAATSAVAVPPEQAAPLPLEGTPSDRLPDVLAVGRGDIQYSLISMAARHPEGRDAAYLEWHSLDHRPEYQRLPENRASLRVVSTPACRAARAVSAAPFDAVDHVMTYHFAGTSYPPGFAPLGVALDKGGRMAIRLPPVTRMNLSLAGKAAAPRAVAGADVLPWRPALGIYLIVERGRRSPEALLELPGVAGIWWHDGQPAGGRYGDDYSGCQVSYCYLDDDPVAVASRMAGPLRQRWASGGLTPLLAAPFHTLVPFAWDRHLP